jgi:hypothetical protein
VLARANVWHFSEQRSEILDTALRVGCGIGEGSFHIKKSPTRRASLLADGWGSVAWTGN